MTAWSLLCGFWKMRIWGQIISQLQVKTSAGGTRQVCRYKRCAAVPEKGLTKCRFRNDTIIATYTCVYLIVETGPMSRAKGHFQRSYFEVSRHVCCKKEVYGQKAQCLEQNRHSINTCFINIRRHGWMNEGMRNR